MGRDTQKIMPRKRGNPRFEMVLPTSKNIVRTLSMASFSSWVTCSLCTPGMAVLWSFSSRKNSPWFSLKACRRVPHNEPEAPRQGQNKQQKLFSPLRYILLVRTLLVMNIKKKHACESPDNDQRNKCFQFLTIYAIKNFVGD